MQDSYVENPLATKPIKNLIWIYVIPGIISQLVNSVHNIVDQVFLGWKVGDLGIAATNIVFPVSAIITGLSALIGMEARRPSLLLVPLLLILPLFLGIDGILFAGAVSDGIAGVVALSIGLGEVRRLKKMQEELPEVK